MTSINSVNVVGQEQNYKKPSKGAIIGGTIAGFMVNNVSSGLPVMLTTSETANRMKKLSQTLTPDEFRHVEVAVVDAMKKTGLKDKGVEIIETTAENAEKVQNIMAKEANIGFLKFLPKPLKRLVQKQSIDELSRGVNACYVQTANKIVVPKDNNLILSHFHEIGHAMNANLSKVGKVLQKSRSASALSLPILLIALFKTKKAEGEQPKNKLDKATTFIKNNAGKLTFMTFVPVLLEEGLASLKGNKLAKELLNPELAKKVAKSNALGFASYFVIATITSLGIYLGTKVKDKIAHNKVIS